MSKIIIAFVLRLPEPFEVQGQNSFAEIMAGSVALACYLAICQFWIAPKDERSGKAKWPVVIVMAAPVVAWAVCFVCRDGLGGWWIRGLPILAAGICGIGVGAVLAARRAGKIKAV